MLYVQFDGAIWQDLYPVLLEIDQQFWKGRKQEFRLSVIDLNRGTAVREKLRTATPLNVILREIIAADPTYRSVFSNAVPTISGIFCDIGKHPDCSQMLIRAYASWREGFAIEFDLTLNGRDLKVNNLPPDFSTLDRLVESPMITAYRELTTSSPIIIHLHKEKGRSFEWAAEAVQYHGTIDDLQRDTFFVSVASRQAMNPLPSLFYYPELDIAWIRIRSPSQATMRYFENLKVTPEITWKLKQQSGQFFGRTDGSIINTNR